MTEACNIALKKGRKSSKMSIEKTAEELGYSARHIRRIEKGDVKSTDDRLVAKSINAFGNIEPGVVYLNNNAVYVDFFGEIITTDPIHAAMEYLRENEDDRQILRNLQDWSLNDGKEPLPPDVEQELKETLQAIVKVILANHQAKKNCPRELIGSSQTTGDTK